jgi:hypothetical protein
MRAFYNSCKPGIQTSRTLLESIKPLSATCRDSPWASTESCNLCFGLPSKFIKCSPLEISIACANLAFVQEGFTYDGLARSALPPAVVALSGACTTLWSCCPCPVLGASVAAVPACERRACCSALRECLPLPWPPLPACGASEGEMLKTSRIRFTFSTDLGCDGGYGGCREACKLLAPSPRLEHTLGLRSGGQGEVAEMWTACGDKTGPGKAAPCQGESILLIS